MFNEIARKVLSEMAIGNLTLRDFNVEMKNLGFTYREGAGSSRMYYIPEYGDKSSVTIHAHSESDTIDPSALRMVKNVLNNIGWFKDPENFKKFPFDEWGISKTDVAIDTTKEDIEKANEEYKDAEVSPVFPIKNSICVLKTKNGVNLCRSSNDRRPLLGSWFGYFGYDRRTNKIPCLKNDKWDD